MKIKNDLYEEFHRVTKSHRFIISKRDFTHGFIISQIDKNLMKTGNALDIGCGTGSISFYLASRGLNVLGIDISTKAINACIADAKKFHLNNIQFKVSTAESLKNTPERYNFIVCLEVIEHIENDKQLLQTIFKLLTKNGILILSTPSLNAPLFRLNLLNDFDQRVGHLRRYNISSLLQMLENVGFEVKSYSLTEGILRNSLFTFKIGGLLLKIINRSNLISTVFTKLDRLSMKLFGESDLVIVATKP